jgi:hypothetical protein
MANTTAPASLSVYRGQSRRGRIGEGPGRPVTQGEQYLDASRPIDQNADLLDAIRPWMSLDSDPSDHQKLGDRLESWSFFSWGDWQLVARLVSAGTYDRRAAYFAHGRLWPLASGPGFDPGLHIGRSEAFEAPWRDDNPGQRVREPAPALSGVDQIKAEPDVAALFLAHLLQSCVRRRPLVVLAPLSDFAVGAPLHSLLSFARGALPASLRKECRVRIYTRTPELFLRTPGAALIATPDDMQEQVRSVRRDAFIIDRQGRLLSGEPLEPVARDYGKAVVERATNIPAGLTLFGERFRYTGRLPGERDVRAIQITYNLAVALAGPPEDLGDLVQSYLPRIAHKLGPEVDWQQLVTVEEWRAFPLEPVLALLLMDSRELSPGMRELQKAAERAGALSRAVERGVLDPSRIQTLLQEAPSSRLAAVAQELLQVSRLVEDKERWGSVLELLLKMLHRLPIPPELASLLVQSLVSSGELRHPWLETMASQLIEYQDLLQALGVNSLLKLAGRLEMWGEMERIFDFVDIHMSRDLQPTTDTLIRTGWWTAWRDRSRLMAGNTEENRRAAEAWLISRSWTEERAREATWEDWNRVMEDLPPGPSETGWRALWSGEEGPRRLWPWIPPFEEDQLASLAERSPDLVSLAELAEAVSKDSSPPDFEEPVYRFILQHSRFGVYFGQADALGWLLDGSRAGLPPLGLADSLWLWQMAGSRMELAFQARLDSVRHCLEKDQQAEEAIRAADNPKLWNVTRFVEALAVWMSRRGSVEEIGLVLAEKIDRQIEAEPERRPKTVKRQLVRDLMRHDLKKAASLLDPDLPGEVEEENLMESVVNALATGVHNDPCWRVLAEKIESGTKGRHPLLAVAERVRSEKGERRAALVRTGWRTFEAAARARPWLVHQRPEQGDLPVFDLAASLSEPGGLGNAALRVIFSADPSQRGKVEWWEALLGRLLGWRRCSPLDCPEDRRDVALALVVRLLDDLELAERQVFWSALARRAGKLEWDLLVGAQ